MTSMVKLGFDRALHIIVETPDETITKKYFKV